MRLAPAAVASTRSSAPTSASTRGRLRFSPTLAMSRSTASPCRLRDDRYSSTASGTISPIIEIGLYMRRTKIIATVGPACDNDGTIAALIASGVDIFRLNYSHGTRESQAQTFHRLRRAAALAGRQAAILQDLGGPKIRTGTLEGGTPIQLEAGNPLRIATGTAPGGPGHISTAFEGLARAVKPGDRLLLADGFIELQVESTDGAEIQTTVVQGGALGEHKGINAPGVPLAASAVTPKDVADLQAGLSLGVDIVALSFVQTAADLTRARKLMAAAGAPAVPLVA